MSAVRSSLWVALAIGLTGATLSAEQSVLKSSARLEPWQTSWEKFVETHNACIKVPSCDTKRFLDKEVRWEGVVSSIDLTKQPPGIVMDMSGPMFVDKNGVGVDIDNRTDLLVFVLHPEPSEIAGWKDVAKGQRVHFRAKTSGGLTGSVLSFSAIPGHKMLMISTSGGAFLKRLSEK